LNVFIVNDHAQAWSGRVRLRVEQGGSTVSTAERSCRVPELGREILTFEVTLPNQPGLTTIVAEHEDASGEVVRSCRDLRLVQENP